MGQLTAQKAKLVADPQDAEVIIVNTCGFIDLAKEESVEAIIEAEQLKKSDPKKKIIVCGCLSQRYARQLREEMPLVDGFFGTEDYENILDFLGYSPELSPEYLYEKRILSTPSHYAYLKISEGCNHKCAFCAIPLMRGRHRSRSLPDILKEAKILAQQGVKELIIISQDTTFYGLDIYQSQKIVDLLKHLEEIEGIEWIRLHYLYPTTVQDQLIDYLADSRKVLPYLDMPIQHISDSILRIMKRGGTSRRIRNILEQARKKIRDVTLRTTFIVGHPGETEDDFATLKEFVTEFRFDRMGVFKYSHEENTGAFQLKDLEGALKETRYTELMNIQQRISLEKNQEKIGSQMKVLIDEVDWKTLTAVGRTRGDSPEIDNEVIIHSLQKALRVGNFVNVEIEDASEYELYGKLGD
jgi:ribosomal protein S12 methylthiotransferase